MEDLHFTFLVPNLAVFKFTFSGFYVTELHSMCLPILYIFLVLVVKCILKIFVGLNMKIQILSSHKE